MYTIFQRMYIIMSIQCTQLKKKNCRQISAFITLSSSISPPNYQGKGGGGWLMISWFGSWLIVVFLMFALFITHYWKPLMFLSLSRAFIVLSYLKWCLSFLGQLQGVGFLQLISLLRRTCVLLICVAYVNVMRKL